MAYIPKKSEFKKIQDNQLHQSVNEVYNSYEAYEPTIYVDNVSTNWTGEVDLESGKNTITVNKGISTNSYADYPYVPYILFQAPYMKKIGGYWNTLRENKYIASDYFNELSLSDTAPATGYNASLIYLVCITDWDTLADDEIHLTDSTFALKAAPTSTAEFGNPGIYLGRIDYNFSDGAKGTESTDLAYITASGTTLYDSDSLTLEDFSYNLYPLGIAVWNDNKTFIERWVQLHVGDLVWELTNAFAAKEDEVPGGGPGGDHSAYVTHKTWKADLDWDSTGTDLWMIDDSISYLGTFVELRAHADTMSTDPNAGTAFDYHDTLYIPASIAADYSVDIKAAGTGSTVNIVFDSSDGSMRVEYGEDCRLWLWWTVVDEPTIQTGCPTDCSTCPQFVDVAVSGFGTGGGCDSWNITATLDNTLAGGDCTWDDPGESPIYLHCAGNRWIVTFIGNEDVSQFYKDNTNNCPPYGVYTAIDGTCTGGSCTVSEYVP